eukprot:TRINITY_DN1902_c0_g1_i3.p1 TRINITY_DN1902_c0_g1~~TRINITY_DN1902_c0_g1_i3.p1  ORF type:complete len:447 (+),score=103.04 TRINITY_DN1902_c0_g1_i3:41-1342(+)
MSAVVSTIGYDKTAMSIFTVLAVLHCVLSVIQLVVLWKRRRHRFIAVRGKGTHFWCVTSVTALVCSGFIVLAANAPCVVSVTLIVLFFIITCLMTLEKWVLIYYLVTSTKEAQACVKQDHVKERREGVFDIELYRRSAGVKGFWSRCVQKHKRMVLESKDRVCSTLKAVDLVLGVLIFGITMAVFAEVSKGQVMVDTWTEQCMVNAFIAVRACVVFLGLLAILAAYIVYAIRGVQDNFKVGWEAKILCFFASICAVGILALVIAPQRIVAVPGFMYFFWIAVEFIPCEIIIISMTFGLAYWISQDQHGDEDLRLKSQSQDSSHNSSKIRTRRLPSNAVETKDQYLERALKDDELMILFERFLVREFSVENLLLYRAAVSLEDKMKKTTVDRQSTAEEFLNRVIQRRGDFMAFFEVFFYREFQIGSEHLFQHPK